MYLSFSVEYLHQLLEQILLLSWTVSQLPNLQSCPLDYFVWELIAMLLPSLHYLCVASS
uniref:Uncharacterized protein n=1 Tax=Octopus bimaculoides TaxID=37653 RepID=A0A0L8HER3_OCTBM